MVLRIAAEHDVDLERVTGSGRGGRVRKQDVLAFIGDAGGAAAPAEPPMHIESPYRRTPAGAAAARATPGRARPDACGAWAGASEPLSRMRQSIGRHMLDSLRTAATCTTIVEADMTRVEAARQRAGLTALPFVARATIETLREFSSLNATLEDETFTSYEAVHLGIAVSLGEGGLIVPVIHHAQDFSVEGLARRIRELAGRARSNQLTADEVRGGTFTITNPAGTARSSPRRSSTSRRSRSSTPRRSSSGRS